MDLRMYRKILCFFFALTIIGILFMACDRKDSNATGKIYKGVTNGYSGKLTVKATITKNGTIEAIKVEGDDESSELGGPAINSIAREIIRNQSTVVDSVSGATVTSNAMIEATKKALDKAGITK